MIPTIKRSLLGASLLVSLAASSQAAVILAVDFNRINTTPATSPTQSGFQAFNITESTTGARTASFTASDASTITVNLPVGTTTSRDRGTTRVPNVGAFTYSDLYRDLAVQIGRNTGAAGGATPTLAQVVAATSMSLTGLTANRTYTIRLWSVNPDNDNNQTATWFNLTPQTFTSQGAEISLGTILNVAISNPTSNTDYSILATVTSNQNGELYFRQSMSSGSGHINGFELIPEPSSAMALVSSIALLLGIRRRRTA